MMRKKQRDGGAYSARGCGAAEAASGAALAEARSSAPRAPGAGEPGILSQHEVRACQVR